MADIKPAPAAGHDGFVADGLAKVRSALSDAPSHAALTVQEFESGMRALLSHLWQRRPADVPDPLPTPAPPKPEGSKVSG